MRHAVALAFCALIATTPMLVSAKEKTEEAASKPATPAEPPCEKGVAKNFNVNVYGDGNEKSLSAARNGAEALKKALESEGSKFNLQSTDSSYTIGTQNNYDATDYNYSVSLNYTVMSEDVAQKFTDQLADHKRRFSFSSYTSKCEAPAS